MHILHLFEAVYKSHVLTLEKKDLECRQGIHGETIETRRGRLQIVIENWKENLKSQ